MWYDEAMNGVPANKVLGKAYFGPNADDRRQTDLQGVQNNLSIRAVQARIHDSAVLPLILLMCETGKNCWIDHEKLSTGKYLTHECIVVGQSLKEGTRLNYMKVLADKAMPNAKETIDQKEDDQMSRMIQEMAALDDKGTEIEDDFDSRYKALEANGASKEGDDALAGSD